ncbi:MAG: hypothetical protein M1822_006429 [Bathelium mastoideum]|nr:MAG: hypothetical protein M1822_006429 [Bathelium mastoideum]
MLDERLGVSRKPTPSLADLPTDNASAPRSSYVRLPERIRVRSIPVRRILAALAGGELDLPSSELCPIVFLRPFKFFVYAEQHIREKLRDLQEIHDKKLAALLELQSMHTNMQTTLGDSKDAGQHKGATSGGTENIAEKVIAHSSEALSSNDYLQAAEDGIAEYGPSCFSVDELFTKIDHDSLWRLTYSEIRQALNDLRCLVGVIDETVTPLRSHFQQGPKTVFFSDLWYFFEVGSYVFVKDKFIPQKVWQIIQATPGRKLFGPPEGFEGPWCPWRGLTGPIVLECYYLDYDGVKWVPVFKRFHIESFSGSQSTASLSILPLHVAEKEGFVRTDTIKRRGEEFLKSREHRHLYYSGRSLDKTPLGEQMYQPDPLGTGQSRVISEIIESQVVVDFERARQAVPDWAPKSNEMTFHIPKAAEFDDPDEIVESDSYWDTKYRDEFLDEAEKKWQTWDKDTSTKHPSGDDLLLLPDRIFAFVLRTRSWTCLRLEVDDQGNKQPHEIVPKKAVWDHLKIDPGHKRIIQSLIDAQFSNREEQNKTFDLIADKGKGVIILLHGVPGVGKARISINA